MKMYNNYYLLKKIEDKQGEISYASVLDSSTYKGEIVKTPNKGIDLPQVGDKVIFLKGSGEDVGEGLKAVPFTDIIMKI